MTCPNCKEVTVCKAIPPAHIAVESGQRWFRVGHEDVAWFRRGRECLECGGEWLTAEMPEDLVDELVTLRNALADIKSNAESYIAESHAASQALENLSQSLDVLRTLNVYKGA